MLLGTVALDEALQRVPGLPRLYVLTSGPLPPNPSELLSLERFGKVVSLLRANARVFLDTPAVLPVADPLVLSTHADRSLVRSRSAELTDRGAAPADSGAPRPGTRAGRRPGAHGCCTIVRATCRRATSASRRRRAEGVGHPSRRRPASFRPPRTGRTRPAAPAPPPSRLPRTGQTDQPAAAPPQADCHERGAPTSRSQPHPQADRNADAHPQADRNADAHPQADRNADAHPQADRNADAHPQADPEFNADPPHPQADRNGDAHPQADRNADAHPQADRNERGKPTSRSQPHPQRHHRRRNHADLGGVHSA